ncbi:DUF721 domain-containing protein [Candidatus Babeliales bacterium]|nr:DUF721 domain-containing protein [Candidatus Babeliales bacterium]
MVAKKLSEFLKNIIDKNNRWKIKLLKNWDKIIGSFKNNVIILKIERNLLVLGVSHPTLSHELFMLSDILKKKINSLFDHEQIKYIRFRILDIKPKKNILKKIKKEKTEGKKSYTKKFCLNKVEYLSLKKIQDQELKECLKNFYLSCKREKSEKKKFYKNK